MYRLYFYGRCLHFCLHKLFCTINHIRLFFANNLAFYTNAFPGYVALIIIFVCCYLFPWLIIGSMVHEPQFQQRFFFYRQPQQQLVAGGFGNGGHFHDGRYFPECAGYGGHESLRIFSDCDRVLAGIFCGGLCTAAIVLQAAPYFHL